MEKKTLTYAAPQVEVIAIEIEQAVLNNSAEEWGENQHPF